MSQEFSDQTEVVLCHNCSATGMSNIWDDYNDVGRKIATNYKDCRKCKGSGRLKKRVIIEYAPWIHPVDEFADRLKFTKF